jgi:hypothetical protein
MRHYDIKVVRVKLPISCQFFGTVLKVRTYKFFHWILARHWHLFKHLQVVVCKSINHTYSNFRVSVML